jgi:hypothetical protein
MRTPDTGRHHPLRGELLQRPGCVHGLHIQLRPLDPPFGVSQCGSVLVVAEAKESLNLRVAPALKRQVEGYARRLGISVTAAASVLLAEGLRAERRKERDQ